MQNIKQKLQEFNRRPYKRMELYILFACPWVLVGFFILAGATLISKIVAHEEPLILILAVACIAYGIFALGYLGVFTIRQYMDGIYQQHLKEYGERIAKAKK